MLILSDTVTYDVMLMTILGEKPSCKVRFVPIKKKLHAMNQDMLSHHTSDPSRIDLLTVHHHGRMIYVMTEDLLMKQRERSKNAIFIDAESTIEPVKDLEGQDYYYYSLNPKKNAAPYYIHRSTLSRYPQRIRQMVTDGWISTEKTTYTDFDDITAFPLPGKGMMIMIEDFHRPEYIGVPKIGHLWTTVYEMISARKDSYLMMTDKAFRGYATMRGWIKGKIPMDRPLKRWSNMVRKGEETIPVLTKSDEIIEHLFTDFGTIERTKMRYSRKDDMMIVKTLDRLIREVNAYTTIPLPIRGKTMTTYRILVADVRLSIRCAKNEISKLSGVWILTAVPIVLCSNLYRLRKIEVNDLRLYTDFFDYCDKVKHQGRDVYFDVFGDYGSSIMLNLLNVYEQKIPREVVTKMINSPIYVFRKGSGKGRRIDSFDKISEMLGPFSLFTSTSCVDSDDAGDSFDPPFDNQLLTLTETIGDLPTYNDVYKLLLENRKQFEAYFKNQTSIGRQFFFSHDVNLTDAFGLSSSITILEGNTDWRSNVKHREKILPHDLDIHLGTLFASQYRTEPLPAALITKAFLALNLNIAALGYNCSIILRVPEDLAEEHGWCNCRPEKYVTFFMGSSIGDIVELEAMVSNLFSHLEVEILEEKLTFGRDEDHKCLVVPAKVSYVLSQNVLSRMAEQIYFNPTQMFHMTYSDEAKTCNHDPGLPFTISRPRVRLQTFHHTKLRLDGDLFYSSTNVANEQEQGIIFWIALADDIFVVQKIFEVDCDNLTKIAKNMEMNFYAVTNDVLIIKNAITTYPERKCLLIISIHGLGYDVEYFGRSVKIMDFINEVSEGLNLDVLMVTCRPEQYQSLREKELKQLSPNVNLMLSTGLETYEYINSMSGTYVFQSFIQDEVKSFPDMFVSLMKSGRKACVYGNLTSLGD
jgi:hypothetical protein